LSGLQPGGSVASAKQRGRLRRPGADDDATLGGPVGVFEGSYPLTLDAKGRLTIPAKLRDPLQEACGGQLVLTRWLMRCVRVYPLPVWQKLREQITSGWTMQSENFAKAMMHSADSQLVDSAGRILVKDSLRSYAGLDKRVVLAGDGLALELWDEDRHTKFLDEQMELGLPEELKNMARF
jgi:MraZ protein